MSEHDDLLEPFRRQPESSVLILDYDGTIAPIVDDPALAVPAPGMVDLLDRLASKYATVAVVSGRPLSFLSTMLPGDFCIVGLYGLEGSEKGQRWEHPNGGAWREVMADIAMMAMTAGPEGMRVELKDLSITLHYRGQPELAPAVHEYARTQSERAGLLMRPARMSVELHPPINADKGTVLERLTEDATNVLVAGDDVGDLKAFDALDRLAELGLHTVRIAIASDEVPSELVRRAQVLVAGPSELQGLLGSLL